MLSLPECNPLHLSWMFWAFVKLLNEISSRILHITELPHHCQSNLLCTAFSWWFFSIKPPGIWIVPPKGVVAISWMLIKKRLPMRNVFTSTKFEENVPWGLPFSKIPIFGPLKWCQKPKRNRWSSQPTSNGYVGQPLVFRTNSPGILAFLSQHPENEVGSGWLHKTHLPW